MDSDLAEPNRRFIEALDNISPEMEAKLADAWDEGHQSGFWNGRESSGNTEGLRIGAEHADAMNPYRSVS